MAGRKNNIIVGLMFLFAVLVLGYYTILLKDEFFEGKRYYRIQSEFTNGFGIKKNDPVKILGVYSGSVENVKLNGNKVLVTMKMFNQFTLYENYRIKVKSEGFMGAKAVEITPGVEFDDERTYREVALNQVLIGSPSGDLMGTLEDLVGENKESITDSISNLRVTMANFKDFSYKMNFIADKITRGEGTIGKLIVDDKLANQASETLTNLKDTVEDAREQAPITSFIRAALMAF